jgi:spore coat protein CotH
MVLSDWDGFFNNYFLFQDTGTKKKWSLFVWDEDKTWGDYDGRAEDKLLYNLPLTYGADNDVRPTNGEAFWWRSGGYISRPVLANPHFRTLYFSRVREILETEFTEAKLFPLIDQYGERLRAEVELRAAAAKQDSARARQEFEKNIASLKEFVAKRRGWLLEQEEIRNTGSSPQK